MAPRSTQPFILPRSIKGVPRIFGNFVGKGELAPPSGSTSHEAIEPHPWKEAVKFFSNPVYDQYFHLVLDSLLSSKNQWVTNNGGFWFLCKLCIYLHISRHEWSMHYTHLAFVGFEHSVCCGSLILLPL